VLPAYDIAGFNTNAFILFKKYALKMDFVKNCHCHVRHSNPTQTFPILCSDHIPLVGLWLNIP